MGEGARPSGLTLVVIGLLVGTAQAQLPEGYQVRRQFGKPCRIDTRTLPWRVTSTDDRMAAVEAHALKSWNAEGIRLGLGPFFAATLPGENSDLIIDWTGGGLPADKAGGVFWDANLGYLRVMGLVMDGRFRIPDGNRTQILMQELGHVLGLDHSSDRRDIMWTVMQTRRLYRPSDARLTERDRAALAWLYAQPEWVPILSARQPFVKQPPPAIPARTPETPAPSPEPAFTPVP